MKTLLPGGLIPLPATLISSKVVYASRIPGIHLNTNIDSGGGNDDRAILQAVLDSNIGGKGLHLVLDGYALISDSLRIKGDNVVIDARLGGVFMANNSPNHILTNDFWAVTDYVSISAPKNRNITIIGGVWNGNSTGQASRVESGTGSVSGMWKFGFWFSAVDGLHLKDVTIRNAKTFALTISTSKNIWIENYRALFDDADGSIHGRNQDGLHFWGPVENVYVNGLRSNGDDDVIALNTNENGNFGGFHDHRRGDAGVGGHGKLSNIVIENVWLDNSANGIRIIGYDTGGLIDNVIVRNVHGAIVHTMDNTGTTTTSFEIDGWHVTGANSLTVNDIVNLRLNNIDSGVTVTGDGSATTKTGDYYATSSSAGNSLDTVADKPERLALTGLKAGAKVSQTDVGHLFELVVESAPATNSSWVDLGAWPTIALTDGLMAYWTLDESSGTRADSTSNGFDLTDFGSTGNASGVLGNAAVFAGSTALESASGMPGMSAISVSAWFSGTGSGIIGQVAARDDGPNGSNFRLIAIGNVVVWQCNGDNNLSVAFPNDDALHHVVGTMDASGNRVIYVDGVSLSTDTIGVFTTGLVPITIGANYNSAPTLAGFATGDADEVGIWDRALSSTEVTSLYNSGAGLAYPF